MTAFLTALALLAPAQTVNPPAWRSLPIVEPTGQQARTGSFVVQDRSAVSWERPAFVENVHASTGRKAAKVLVVIYNPVLESEGGARLIDWLKATDPRQASRILADVVREASWGYINYEIVDFLEIDGYPAKVDGFRYDDESYLEVRRTKQWQPATISYRKVFEENDLIERCRREGITEVWLWGADGFHFDEFADYIPNRYARFGPTENVWLYRPYDIPEDLGRTTWVMGFNVEVGPDNMIHSYTHRVESMAALALADGVWDTARKRDPWNVFSFLDLDHPGHASQVGNCHVPPNGTTGYDYGNPRVVESSAWNWWRYPDVRGEPAPISSLAWGGNHFGYQKWILERVPKFPGHTKFGYNNWWLYVANTDEELPDLVLPEATTFEVPESIPKLEGTP